jgi:hypothetical protein
VGLLVAVVMLGRFAQQVGPDGDVRRRLLPLPAGKPRLDLLEQPPVAVRRRRSRGLEIMENYIAGIS